MPDSYRNKPGLHALIQYNASKTIAETPHFVFHIETNYNFDSCIWESGGHPIPTDAWTTDRIVDQSIDTERGDIIKFSNFQIVPNLGRLNLPNVILLVDRK